ncbi:peptidoglycan DD-metalloendopeptidase family protein [Gryllotalpicola sp.]|uniref:M23 family metallopeptidase n=1 Tax=Gryllotalpicola sp. TaxID=1932787 RepID=UPI0026082525|nr:peptidoglycan DD-metalloendopeptidase family protein [Gryllotalpicola sp.]
MLRGLVFCAALALGVLGAACGAGPLAAAAAGAVWNWPLAPSAVIAPFLAPESPYAAGHRGIDLVAADGDQISAPADGRIVFAGVVVDRPVVTLLVTTGELVEFEPVTASVPLGAAVSRGANLGRLAAGGHCDGRCLHVGVRIDGGYVSPLAFFGGVPAAVLLPLG